MTRFRILTTAGIAALTALTAWATAGSTGVALAVTVGIAATLTVPVVDRWPVAGTLAATALAVLFPVATPAATFGVLVVAQRRRFAVVAVVASAGVVAHAVQGLVRPAGGLSYWWWLLLMVVGYGALVGWGQLSQARWALVASLRERARRAEAEQAARVAEAQIQERTRIAREMHDVLAHRLSLVATYAGALEYRPDSSPERLAQAAGVVRDGVSQALAELREVIGVLRDDADPPGPQPVFADLPRLVDEARAAGQTVRLEDRASGQPPELVGRTAYRVVQEGLTNARRHAPGAVVTIALSGQPGTGLSLEIGNPYAGGPSGDGLGLTGLSERVTLAGGQLMAGPVGDTFQLRVRLPWPT